MDEEQNDGEQEEVSRSGSAIDKHKETVKDLFGVFKKSVEKTVGDLTKKKSAPSETSSEADTPPGEVASEASPASAPTPPPKPPVDYTKLAKEKLFHAKKIAKEMVALALDKDIELDFSEAENAELLSTAIYQENIDLMKSHLDAYFSAKKEGEKQALASAQSICRQDQPMLFEMIQDIKMELMLIYKAIEENEAIDSLQEKFDEVTVRKWRPLVDLKESDIDGAFCPSDDFNAKFIDLLSLNAAVNQSIHSKHD